jgi:hypothetical protein
MLRIGHTFQFFIWIYWTDQNVIIQVHNNILFNYIYLLFFNITNQSLLFSFSAILGSVIELQSERYQTKRNNKSG